MRIVSASIQTTSAKPVRTRQLALIAAFGVLYTVLRLIPTFPMIGVAGTFAAGDFVPTLFGVILGPYVASSSIILGTFLAAALGRPLIFVGLDFLPAAVNAIAVGLLVRGRRFAVALLFGILLLFFLIHPLTLVVVGVPLAGQTLFIPYNWFHLVAFVLLLSPLAPRASKWVTEVAIPKLARGFATLAFIGTMMQHLTGGLLFATILGLFQGIIKPEAWPKIWTGIFYAYPPERIVITIIATMIGVPVVRTLFVSGRIERLVSRAPSLTAHMNS